MAFYFQKPYAPEIEQLLRQGRVSIFPVKMWNERRA